MMLATDTPGTSAPAKRPDASKESDEMQSQEKASSICAQRPAEPELDDLSRYRESRPPRCKKHWRLLPCPYCCYEREHGLGAYSEAAQRRAA
jgi:hypothetical protein